MKSAYISLVIVVIVSIAAYFIVEKIDSLAEETKKERFRYEIARCYGFGGKIVEKYSGYYCIGANKEKELVNEN